MAEAPAGLKFRVVRTKFSDINELIIVWFMTARDKNFSINGPLIRAKAQFAEQLNLANFCASEGWMHKWKRRYEIKQMITCVKGEMSTKKSLMSGNTKSSNCVLNMNHKTSLIVMRLGFIFERYQIKLLLMLREPNFKRKNYRLVYMQCDWQKSKCSNLSDENHHQVLFIIINLFLILIYHKLCGHYFLKLVIRIIVINITDIFIIIIDI